ncbi:hypothetical protein [Herbidospora mongoliensis]|uniref:hypothetical protein n=1 Tax=Herbidospora mongoliensis TaxID=688067 RepID=UPI0008345C18|nr:hypothetical protein [Herbidospora mongoliensis]
MTVDVTAARPDDAAVLGEIHAEAWLAAYRPFFDAEFFEKAVARRRGQWHTILAEGADTVLMARLDGRPLALRAPVEAPDLGRTPSGAPTARSGEGRFVGQAEFHRPAS